MYLYIIIFTSKVVENTIGTLRLIVVANGKKVLGAILQGIIAIIWICITGLVVTNILEDPFKIVAFALGSIVGSLLGSILEEKIALGNKLLIIVIDSKKEKQITEKIRKNNFAVTSTLGKGMKQEKAILFILIPRKKVNIIIDIVKNIDNNALVISESAFNICGGYLNQCKK